MPLLVSGAKCLEYDQRGKCEGYGTHLDGDFHHPRQPFPRLGCRNSQMDTAERTFGLLKAGGALCFSVANYRHGPSVACLPSARLSRPDWGGERPQSTVCRSTALGSWGKRLHRAQQARVVAARANGDRLLWIFDEPAFPAAMEHWLSSNRPALYQLMVAGDGKVFTFAIK